MIALQQNFKILPLFLFLIFSCSSCNNEELFSEDISNIQEDNSNFEEEVELIDVSDDIFTTQQNTQVEIDIINNDNSVPGDIVINFTNPENGTISVDDNGTVDNYKDDNITYTPNIDFLGVDSFQYVVCQADNSEICDTADVTLIVQDGTSNLIDDEFSSELKAFPTAYGAGANATGGRGGFVYHVKNLNDDGPDSFREALSKPRPATIVFDVSGTINLSSFLIIQGKDLTIAGQTSPEGGITITSNDGSSRILMDDVENIIIRYIRIRLKDQNTVAFDTYGNTGVAKNLIFDHCSISYGGLLAFVLRGNESTNVTFQRSLIAESKTGCLFGDSQQTHFSYNNSFLNNLFYNVSHRTPNSGSDGRVDHINNVTHNWLSRLSYVNGDIKLNQINNYYSMGGRSDIKINSRHMINVLERKFDYEIYTSGNIIDKGMFTDPNADNRRLWAYFDLGKQRDLAGPEHFVSEQHPLVGIPVPIKTANEVYSEIVNNPDVGANATINDDGSVSRNEDANDKEYLAVMAQGEGAFEHYTAGNFGSDRSFYFESRYINFLSSISSDPISSRELNYDRDKDGMPNKWEILYGTNPDVPDNNSDKDGDGYTNLEEFLNSVDKNK